MKVSTLRVSVALALAVLALSCTPRTQVESAYEPPGEGTVRLTYRGLIGYVPTEVDGRKVIYALLADADYESRSPADRELPLYASKTHPKLSDRLKAFPPHFSVLQVMEGKEKWMRIPLKGGDWEIVKGGSPSDKSIPSQCEGIDPKWCLAKSSVIQDRLKNKPTRGDIAKYKGLDKVWKKIGANVQQALKSGRLAARFLIDRGDLEAAQGDMMFGFDQMRASGAMMVGCDKNKVGPLVQAVVQTFEADEVTFKATKSHTVESYTVTDAGNGIEIFIQNEIAEAIKDPHHGEGDHFDAFRWLYNLSDTPTLGQKFHAWPCPEKAGGTRCPQRELTP
jgi:hypothetical protein